MTIEKKIGKAPCLTFKYIKTYYNQDLSTIKICDPRMITLCLNESFQTGSKD